MKDLRVSSSPIVTILLTFDGTHVPDASDPGPSRPVLVAPTSNSKDSLSRKRVQDDVSSEKESKRLRDEALNAKNPKVNMSFSGYQKSVAQKPNLEKRISFDGESVTPTPKRNVGKCVTSPVKNHSGPSASVFRSQTVVVDVTGVAPSYFRNSGEALTASEQLDELDGLKFSPAFMKRFALDAEDVKHNSVPGWLWDRRGFMVSWECRHDPYFLSFCEQHQLESELCFALAKELRLACSRHLREEMIPAIDSLQDSDDPIFAKAIAKQLQNKQLGFLYTAEDEQACLDLIEKLSQFTDPPTVE